MIPRIAIRGPITLHDELALMVAAGLTSREALISATRLPAEWLGIESETGTIEAGKLTDLILLDQNPLTEIKNTRKIAAVFEGGRWLSRKRLDSILSDLSKRNTVSKDKFGWKKTMAK